MSRVFRIKKRAYSLGQKRCAYCCCQLHWDRLTQFKVSATVEHIVPKSEGGTLALTNTLIVCKSCNEKRKNKNFIGFVTGSLFPKKEYLVQKYEKALEFYEQRRKTNTTMSLR